VLTKEPGVYDAAGTLIFETPKRETSVLRYMSRTLLAAKSIAYSDSASGVYLSTELFLELGVLDQILRERDTWAS
jgi:hypothetical protein